MAGTGRLVAARMTYETVRLLLPGDDRRLRPRASRDLLAGLPVSNTHDRPIEAAMTGAIVAGPLGAVVGGVALFPLGRRRG